MEREEENTGHTHDGQEPEERAEQTGGDADEQAIGEANAARFETVRNAALFGKMTFADQIDYYDPERDEIL